MSSTVRFSSKLMADMMQTQAGDAGAFKIFDLSRVPSPCFVVDEVAVRRNLSVIKEVADRSGAHVLAALKAFSMFSLAPLVREYLEGTCASGLYEARLARQKSAVKSQHSALVTRPAKLMKSSVIPII